MFGQWYSFQYLKDQNFHGSQNDIIHSPPSRPLFAHSLSIQHQRTGLIFLFSPLMLVATYTSRTRQRQGPWFARRQMKTRSTVFPVATRPDIGSVAEICRPTMMPCTTLDCILYLHRLIFHVSIHIFGHIFCHVSSESRA